MKGRQHLQCLTLKIVYGNLKGHFFLYFPLHSPSVYNRSILLLLSKADKTIKCGPLAVMGHYLSLKCVSSHFLSPCLACLWSI